MKKQDFIVIGIILLAAVGIFAFLYFGNNGGAYVNVEIDGKTAESFSLDEDRVYTVKTENGTNTLEIKDGYASVTEADCPDKICVRHRKINRNGESIICLPHRVVITVTDGEGDEIDLVS